MKRVIDFVALFNGSPFACTATEVSETSQCFFSVDEVLSTQVSSLKLKVHIRKFLNQEMCRWRSLHVWSMATETRDGCGHNAYVSHHR